MGYLFERICRMDKRAFLRAVGYVHERSGKSYVGVLWDMVYCGFKYQSGYSDYVEFEFYRLNAEQRGTYLTRGKNNRLIKKYNLRECCGVLEDKSVFNQQFNQYLHREWIDLRCCSFEDFCAFADRHSVIVGKVVNGEGGYGVDVYRTGGVKRKLYRLLLRRGETLVEECIMQNAEMSRLYDGAVNTLRLFTFCDGVQSYYLNGVLKIGNGGSVDNFSSGGMYTFVNEDGVVDTPAIDKNDKEYVVHPISHEEIMGFKVPLFKEAVEMVCEAHRGVRGVGYIGWDVAIGEDSPMIVEGNSFPGVFQKKARFSGGIGCLPKYMRYMSF